MFQGSCCCGQVRFRVSKEPRFLAACHCSRCRKVGSTPFVMVDADSFELLSGRDGIVVWRPEPPFEFQRSFCGTCGTALGEILSGGDTLVVSANCFDDDLGMEIRFHEHVATKPSWATIPDGVKQFEGNPG